MALLEFSAVSSIDQIIAAQQAQGADVLVLADDWPTAQQVAKRVGVRDTRQVLVPATLARRIHEAHKQRKPGFERPALLVMPPVSAAMPASASWLQIQAEAQACGMNVLAVHLTEEGVAA